MKRLIFLQIFFWIEVLDGFSLQGGFCSFSVKMLCFLLHYFIFNNNKNAISSWLPGETLKGTGRNLLCHGVRHDFTMTDACLELGRTIPRGREVPTLKSLRNLTTPNSYYNYDKDYESLQTKKMMKDSPQPWGSEKITDVWGNSFERHCASYPMMGWGKNCIFFLK